MANKIQIRRDTAEHWVSADPTLSQGEIGLDLTSGNIKIGNGVDTWVNLDYAIPDITGLATEGYVDNSITALKAGASSALDTLNELATALGNDANFSATVTTALGLKANSADLSIVATTGSYGDLLNKPVLFDGAYTSLSGRPTLFDGNYNSLTNKPTLFDFNYNSLTNKPNLADVAISGSYADLSGNPEVDAITIGNGTAGSPSIGFSSDISHNTGLFHPGNGIVCVATNGNERVRVDDGGMRVNGFMKVAQVSGNLPNPPEEGMIVLDGTTFKGYNGTSWVNLN